MSKLTDSLAAVSAFLAIWLAVLYNLEFEVFNEYRFLVFLLPVFLLILALGIYSGITVIWRALHFNDCNKEALELQSEIKEARADLVAKGFVFQ